MRVNRIRLWTACLTLPLAVIVVQSASAGASTPTSSQPAPKGTHIKAPSCNTKLNDTAANKAVVIKQTHVNGQTLTSIKAGCNSYTFIGAPGMTYSYSATGASITTPNTKTNGTVASLSLSDVYANAIAVGFSQSQAEEMVAQAMATTTGVAFKAVSSTGTAVKARLSKSVTSSTAATTIIGTPCVWILHANGGQATGRACDIQTLVQQNGGDWYIGDSITSSGHNGTWWNNLTRLDANDNYVKGNSIVEWQPSGFVNTGSCQTYNESVGWNGIGVGSSQTVCPSGIGPEWSDPTTGSGAEWRGCSGNTQSAPDVDIIHSPPNVSDSITVSLGLTWAWC